MTNAMDTVVAGKNWDERCRKAFGKDVNQDVHFLFNELEATTTHKAHKLLLSFISPVFDRMFYGPLALPNVKEEITIVSIPDIKSIIFYDLLNLIYDIEVLPNISVGNVSYFERVQYWIDLLYAAKKYLLKEIQLAITDHINLNIDVYTAYYYLKHGLSLYTEIDTDTCWKVMCENGEEFINCDAFLDLSAEDLLKFLSDNETIAQEADLFKATIKWAKHKMEKENEEVSYDQIRSFVGENTILAIRFNLMKSSEFKELVHKSSLLNQEEIIEILYCYIEKVDLASKFCTKARRQNSVSYIFANARSLSTITLPLKDQFVFEKKSASKFFIHDVYMLPVTNSENFRITVFGGSSTPLTCGFRKPGLSAYAPLIELTFDNPLEIGSHVKGMAIKIQLPPNIQSTYQIYELHTINVKSATIKPKANGQFLCGLIA